MKTIIAGSRSITEYSLLLKAVHLSGFQISLVISGCAQGVDSLGERYAREHHLPLRRFPAQWARFGKSAGFIRNEQMAYHADALLLLWNGFSAGSQNMLHIARHQGLHTFSFIIDEANYSLL